MHMAALTCFERRRECPEIPGEVLRSWDLSHVEMKHELCFREIRYYRIPFHALSFSPQAINRSQKATAHTQNGVSSNRIF